MGAVTARIPLLYCLLYYHTDGWDLKQELFWPALLYPSSNLHSRDRDRLSKDGYFSSSSSEEDSSGWDALDWAFVYRRNLRDRHNHPHNHNNEHHNTRRGRGRNRHVPTHVTAPIRSGATHDKHMHKLCPDFDKWANGIPPNRVKSNKEPLSQVAASISSTPKHHGQGRNRYCNIKDQTELHHLLPGLFMSRRQLQQLMPLLTVNSSTHFRDITKNGRTKHQLDRFVMQPKMVETNEKVSSLKLGTVDQSMCEPCQTEIGYEVLDEVADVRGVVHKVVNFNNAFQFIPIGRCINELRSCGGGQGSSCRQVYRAQWTLVFSPATGPQLVAHEVPSHCECLNIGASETSFTHDKGDSRGVHDSTGVTEASIDTQQAATD